MPDTPLRLARHPQTWRVWGGAAVFFDPLSGDTHRIGAPGGSILALLAESDHTRADINSVLGTTVTAEKINEALDLMLAMELVELA